MGYVGIDWQLLSLRLHTKDNINNICKTTTKLVLRVKLVLIIFLENCAKQ